MSRTSLAKRLDTSIRVAVGLCTTFVLDAAREVASEQKRPVMVIASRRQVESPDLGGGYVGWDTPQWCAQVESAAQDGLVVLARDHGGPYQHPSEAQMEPSEAWRSATESLRCDIESGVELIHIDAGLAQDGPANPDEAVGVALGLVEECRSFASAAGRTIEFEVGIEVQSDHVDTVDDYAAGVGTVQRVIREARGAAPHFVVAQTGTLVSGWRNAGVIAEPESRQHSIESLSQLAAAVRGSGSRLKAHNCDYLDSSAVECLRKRDVWMNVSPEFGLAQTRAVLAACRRAGVSRELDEFSQATIRSGAWRKWVPPDATQDIGDEYKVLLGGAYLFSTHHFDALSQRLDHELRRHGSSTRRVAVDAVKSTIYHYHHGSRTHP